jgi:methylenetetrahydrofolate dehydrogenase (NADP+)/methenyltetrahydrofolate cyclohydrolase
VGINASVLRFDTIDQDELTQLIYQLNDDKDVHGVIVQLPLPQHLNERQAVECVSPSKDVDGFLFT